MMGVVSLRVRAYACFKYLFIYLFIYTHSILTCYVGVGTASRQAMLRMWRLNSWKPVASIHGKISGTYSPDALRGGVRAGGFRDQIFSQSYSIRLSSVSDSDEKQTIIPQYHNAYSKQNLWDYRH